MNIYGLLGRVHSALFAFKAHYLRRIFSFCLNILVITSILLSTAAGLVKTAQAAPENDDVVDVEPIVSTAGL
jgi:hypothetical protein